MERKISFDPADFNGMLRLMDEHGNSNTSFFGETEDGERTRISIRKDEITVETYQLNNWTRINTYYRDGSREERYCR